MKPGPKPRVASAAELRLARRILVAVARLHRCAPVDLLGSARPWRLVWPRMVAMYVMRYRTRWPVRLIAECFHRSPEAVVYALRRARETVETEPARAAEIHHLCLLWRT